METEKARKADCIVWVEWMVKPISYAVLSGPKFFVQRTTF